MLNFIVKTHQKNVVYKQPHVFILNKGMNSGKPQKEPFTNSFVVICENESDCENLYYVAYSLWKSNFWHQHLVGSVIPFIRLPEFKKEFIRKANILMQEHEQHKKHITTLQMLESSEKQFQKNLNRINDLRRAIIHGYCNK